MTGTSAFAETRHRDETKATTRNEQNRTDRTRQFNANPNDRWLILKLLDDDFLGSIMTNQKYEVNSKSPLG